VLAYDADNAGQNAIQRVYEWERTHDVEVVVAAMPAGADPGQLAKDAPDVLRQAIEGARPFLAFRVDRQLAGADLSTPERRARVADRALAVVAEHPSDLARDEYVMYVADRCHLDAGLLRARLEVLRSDPDERALLLKDRATTTQRPAEEPPRPAPVQRRADPSLRPGLEALKVAVHRPDLVAARLDACLFVDPLQRRTFETLLEAESLGEAVDGADEPVADLLRQLIVEVPEVEVTSLGDPVQAVVAQLVRVATQRALEALMSEVRVTPGGLNEHHATIAEVKRLRMELDAPETAERAAQALVAWLAERERG
jgi:DNA primase